MSADKGAGFRLVHMIGGFGYGGTERLCLNLVAAMPQEVRHTVIALDPTRTGMEGAFRGCPNVKIEYGSPPTVGRLRFLVRMTRSFRRIHPDAAIVYTFGVSHVLTGLAWWLAGYGGRPVVVSGGTAAPEGSVRWKWRILVLLSRCLRLPIMSCSNWVQESLQDLGVGLPSNSRVIHHGVDVQRFAAAAREAREDRDPNSPWVVGMVARMDGAKDHASLIRAFSALPEWLGGRRIVLRLVGDGLLRSEFERSTESLGVAGRVEFLGNRDDVPALLGGFDVYVFSTTRDEGFGIALIEAMAAGVPVVATDVPPCREVTGEGESAILVPPHDAEALARAIRALIEDESRRELLGVAGRQRATRLFDLSVTATRWLAAIGGPA